jgi:hypothetical protein
VKNINDLRQSCTGENSGQRGAVGGRDAGLDAFCSSLQACFMVLKREQTTGLISAPNRIPLSPCPPRPTTSHSHTLAHSLTHSLSQHVHLQLPRTNNLITQQIHDGTTSTSTSRVTTFLVICSMRGAERGWTYRRSTGKC